MIVIGVVILAQSLLFVYLLRFLFYYSSCYIYIVFVAFLIDQGLKIFMILLKWILDQMYFIDLAFFL